jgi:putative transposase
MQRIGLKGAVSGRAFRITTIPGAFADRPVDLVERNFSATRPNQLGGGSYLCGDLAGFAYVALIIDVFSRRLVGWRVSASLSADLALDALGHALYQRAGNLDGLIHHSDRGTQYLSIRYTERLADAGIAPSVGSRGDSYDNALAESIIGVFKTEVIRRRGRARGWRRLRGRGARAVGGTYLPHLRGRPFDLSSRGPRMKILAFITEPAVMARILDHLDKRESGDGTR